MRVGPDRANARVRTPLGRICMHIVTWVCVLASMGGCAAMQMNADTKCSEFMKASKSARDDTVTRVAAERGNGVVTTPLGRPNVEYLCAQQPDWTLGHVIDLSK